MGFFFSITGKLIWVEVGYEVREGIKKSVENLSS